MPPRRSRCRGRRHRSSVTGLGFHPEKTTARVPTTRRAARASRHPAGRPEHRPGRRRRRALVGPPGEAPKWTRQCRIWHRQCRFGAQPARGRRPPPQQEEGRGVAALVAERRRRRPSRPRATRGPSEWGPRRQVEVPATTSQAPQRPPAPPPGVDPVPGSPDLGTSAPEQPRPPRLKPAAPRRPAPTREPRPGRDAPPSPSSPAAGLPVACSGDGEERRRGLEAAVRGSPPVA